MHLKVEHQTRYVYSENVFLEPHHLYFYPSVRPEIKINEFEINVIPEPDGMSQRLDIENNSYYQIWFNDLLNSMDIRMKMKVETCDINPFDFLLEDTMRPAQKPARKIYLETFNKLENELMLWVSGIRDKSSDIPSLLLNLVTEISNGWDHEIRYSSDLHEPNECFNQKKGSCRDLSWMLMEILRKLDMPSRFVSGYSHNPELEDGHELHAWVEVWVNGAGWIGIDPTAGLFTDANYIPVASSFHPSNTLPVQGNYRGKAESELQTRVQISEW
jgi:hypothetical protein